MGTVIFPDAAYKVFLTASADERAKRRYKQLKDKGVSVNLDSLLHEIVARDERDAGRAVAPLKPAADAVDLDTTGMPIDRGDRTRARGAAGFPAAALVSRFRQSAPHHGRGFPAQKTPAASAAGSSTRASAQQVGPATIRRQPVCSTEKSTMTESFAELFEQSQIALAKLKPGAIVTGIVVEIRSDVVVINAGLKSEGIVPDRAVP